VRRAKVENRPPIIPLPSAHRWG